MSVCKNISTNKEPQTYGGCKSGDPRHPARVGSPHSPAPSHHFQSVTGISLAGATRTYLQRARLRLGKDDIQEMASGPRI